jgi:DNA-directed RNA polymerase specialized sigma24 family protein
MNEDRASAIARYRREIVGRYRAAYQSYATKLCGDPSRAELAMRGAFAQAFKSLQACGSPDRFATWFFEILTQQCEGCAEGRSTRALHIDDLAHDLS